MNISLKNIILTLCVSVTSVSASLQDSYPELDDTNTAVSSLGNTSVPARLQDRYFELKGNGKDPVLLLTVTLISPSFKELWRELNKKRPIAGGKYESLSDQSFSIAMPRQEKSIDIFLLRTKLFLLLKDDNAKRLLVREAMSGERSLDKSTLGKKQDEIKNNFKVIARAMRNLDAALIEDAESRYKASMEGEYMSSDDSSDDE